MVPIPAPNGDGPDKDATFLHRKTPPVVPSRAAQFWNRSGHWRLLAGVRERRPSGRAVR